MLRILIEPTTFEILPMQHRQNPYIDVHHRFQQKKVAAQHKALVRALERPISVNIGRPETLPDIVFVANGGLALPRLKIPTILLPNMRFPQRQAELPYLTQIFHDLGLKTIAYPGKEPFEGQAELKWFDGGRKAVCGYGHRATRKTFRELARFFERIYDVPPELLVLPLVSDNYYHLDVAMLEYDDAKCIVHKRAFSEGSLRRLRAFLGSDNVTVIDTPDSFCLNAVVDGARLITHKLTDPLLKDQLEALTGRQLVQIDTTEFEKSGGSVRCMTLDLFHGAQ